MRRGRLAWLPPDALLAVALAAGAGAEEREVQSVGAVPLREDGADRAPREAALEEAVQGAVLRVARELLPADFALPGPETPPGREPSGGADGEVPETLEDWLAGRLGKDLLVYATRYSILEDRGRRPAVFSSDPEVTSEYVVLAAVAVDATALTRRLGEVGLLGPSGPTTELVLVVEGLQSYPPLAALRRALEADLGVRSVVPVEFSPGRAVLVVAADRDARAVVGALERQAPAGLQVIPVELGAREATLLVDWSPGAAPGPATR